MRKVRRSQFVSPFGPGALIDLVGESFVVEDAGNWRGPLEEIVFPRLAAYLKVAHLRSPSPRSRWLPYYRFPRRLFCPNCRRVRFWSRHDEKQNAAPVCDKCTVTTRLVPMRFVAVCANGHLDDVNWRNWAHSADRNTRNQQQCGVNEIRFDSKADVGSGLQSLTVTCIACKASRSLEELSQKYRVRCSGRQPWQSSADEVNCDERMVVMQRGAAAVYFPTVVSAIDIPPESSWSSINNPLTKLRQNNDFVWLQNSPNHALRSAMINVVANQTGISTAEVEAALLSMTGEVHYDPDAGPDDIPVEEWVALTNPQAEPHDHKDHFITRRADRPLRGDSPISSAWRGFISDVIMVDRLREVRVLQHFERHTMNESVASNLAPNPDFLPATEVFGEGFFIRFDEEELVSWEQLPKVRDRCSSLVRRRQQARSTWLKEPTPRRLLLHTFAHLLLRHTAFDAGYSTSSLRERLYVTEGQEGPAMAGILIYTAAGDSEGTLGGLVRMGEFPRLIRLLDMSVAAANWCSFDPVCSESSGQGPHGLSLAACHACSLVPETSCVEANRLLDRRLLIDPDYGFFRSLLPLLEQALGGEH
nr:DUF1998 domain-containing protein [Lentzea albida]